jgi:ribosomal protein L18
VIQAKNKYQTPKYRLVVRFTNKQVICQVVYSLIDGDRILCQATSTELPRYGLKAGLKNYAAAYCTGLLVARRLLKQLGLDDVYEGNTEVDGAVVKTEVGKQTYYVDEVDEDKRPFRCLLDVGCRPTTTGCRIFGAMKGAADGGLDIPHCEKRFPGFDRDSKEYDADLHRERIMGGHVGEYMEYLDEEVRLLHRTLCFFCFGRLEMHQTNPSCDCVCLFLYRHYRITPSTKNTLKDTLSMRLKRMDWKNCTKVCTRRFGRIRRRRKRRRLHPIRISNANPS